MSIISLPKAAVLAAPSPYPASFDGSTWRYQLALFTLMAIAIVAAKLLLWMLRETWRGRHDALPLEPLFAFRIIILFSALGAFLRCAPEAALMITWREDADLAAHILVAKRWIDAVTFIPSMTWMATVFVFYPRICMNLVRMSRADGPPLTTPVIPWDRIHRLGTTLALTFAISLLIALGKRW